MYLCENNIQLVRRGYRLIAIINLRARLGNRVNICELLLNTVNRKKRNIVDTL
jgi:hypothetical protein